VATKRTPALSRVTWSVIVVLLTVGVVCMFLPKIAELRGLQRKQAALEASNRLAEMETRDLQDKRQRFDSDPEFVERTAREAGYVKPGDTVFRFQDDEQPTRPTTGSRP